MQHAAPQGPVAEPGTDSPLSVAISARDRDILAQVEDAIFRGDVLLAFQPVVVTGRQDRPAFYEGLIRILDRDGRIIPARDFIDAVEARETGRRIDCLALQHGLRTLRERPDIRLSINMSARSIGYRDWTRILDTALAEDPTLGERLILEITEASAILMPEIVQVFMSDLQMRGIAFALDDFGAGYTALGHLKEMYFDIIKIDGHFVRGIAHCPDNQVLVRALVSIARHFDMLTIAERVETDEDARFLERIGIDCLQGFLFGAPTIRPSWTADRHRRQAV